MQLSDEDRFKDLHSNFYQTLNNSNDVNYNKQGALFDEYFPNAAILIKSQIKKL